MTADWKRVGSNQSRDNTEVQTAQRAGQVAYWNAIKAHRPSLKIVGNVEGDLSQPEYREKLNGAFLEGAMGVSYSVETWAGWDAMMARVRPFAPTPPSRTTSSCRPTAARATTPRCATAWRRP